MSRPKSSVSMVLAGCCLLVSTVIAQVTNIQLPEILGVFAGDTINVGKLESITGDPYFATNPADCTGKFDSETVGSISFKRDDPWKENATKLINAYALATLANTVGSHQFTFSCKNKVNNSEYAVVGRIEVTVPTGDAVYGIRTINPSIELKFFNDSRNFYKELGFFPLKIGEANFRKLSAEPADTYFKEGLIPPVSPAVFYDTDGVKTLAPFGFISIQQGCKKLLTTDPANAEECVAVLKDNKTAVFFKYNNNDGLLMPRLTKTSERVVQSDDAFAFGGCFGGQKLISGSSSWGLFCWFFNPTTKKTKIVDTRDANKLADVEVAYRIVEQQRAGSSFLCFLIDELKGGSYKIGCITTGNSFANLSFFNELGQTATSSLTVTTGLKSTCTVPITNLTGNTAPFRGFVAFGSCNSSSFSGYIDVDNNIPRDATLVVLNLSAPLQSQGEVIRLPTSVTATGYICKFPRDIAYFVTANGKSEINFQGIAEDTAGRILKIPLGGVVTVLSTLCNSKGATVLLDLNSARYLLHIEPPRTNSPSLLTRIPIFEKISSTVDTYDATDDYLSGILYNGNVGAGKQLQFSDVFSFRSLGYQVDTHNPSASVAGTFRTKVTQKSETGPSNSYEVALTLFDSSPQLDARPGLTSMPADVNDDVQKYYSLSGNFSNIWIDNSTVFAFTPLVTSNLNASVQPRGTRPLFVLGNEYLINLIDGTFTSEKDGSAAMTIGSPLSNDANFVGVVDTPAGYQVAVLASKNRESVQLVYYNNKTMKVEVTALLAVNDTILNGTALHGINSKGEPSIIVAAKPRYGSLSAARHVYVKYQVDAGTGNVTTTSLEFGAHIFRRAPKSRSFEKYVVQVIEDESSQGDMFASCKTLTVVGPGIRTAMVYPVCALPEYRDVRHFVNKATKTGNTLRLEVFSTASTPEMGFGEVVALEADIFDGNNFRPNKDIVWKVTSLRKFQKFVGHVEAIFRKGDEEVIIGLRKEPVPLGNDNRYPASSFVFSFFKSDPATPYHQFEESNVDFAAAFEYKNNWFFSMFNTTNGDHKTTVVNYTVPMLKLLPGSTPETIAAQSITFNKGSPNEVKRPMKAIVAPKPTPTPESSSSTWIIVLVSVLVVGILGGVAYYYFFHRRETIRRESDLNANNTSRITAEH